MTSTARSKKRKRGSRGSRKGPGSIIGDPDLNQIRKEARMLEMEIRSGGQREEEGRGEEGKREQDGQPSSKRRNFKKKKDKAAKLSELMKEIMIMREAQGLSGLFRPRESGVVEHRLEPTDMDELEREESGTPEVDATVYTDPIPASEVTDLYKKELSGKTIKGGGIIPYAILTRHLVGDQIWKIPDKQQFHEFMINYDVVTLGDKNLNRNIAWNNFWGGVGLVGINSKNMDLFRTTREIILDTIIDEYDFCSVPKIALEDNEQNLSVMLMGDMKAADISTFTRTLGKKNDGFKGKLRLVRSKTFTNNDKTRNGQTMNGWRLLELKGDEEFMQSLAQFEANHPFQLWGGRVFIRGGIRKPPGPLWSKRSTLGRTGPR